ncbi:unnamed protein product [Darwinula stevensoni]|uniref:Cadherin domain-containing protein n=1 Tax=Darwinula stevensoni TaxID=69355 RepID=A0A7R8ZX12_9CRUS|nr:unnamed protein product [Darwinula stevensoni]CAG0878551.1 unnamed protein product [Darwinula stevensoni]
MCRIFCSVREGSPVGTEVDYNGPQSRPLVFNPNPSGRGVVSVKIVEDEGLFDVAPSVITGESGELSIRVKDSARLDYETTTKTTFKIVASRADSELPLSATAEVTVYIEDVNDNPPVFKKTRYVAQVPENATLGTLITQVSATDGDSPDTPFGQVMYSRLTGPVGEKLALDPLSGVISVATRNPGFDRESIPEFKVTVEAVDDNGRGNAAMAEVLIQLLDVNDSPPKFPRSYYGGVLNPGMNSLKTPVIVQATDEDEGDNGKIRYEIVSGNANNMFNINSATGEVTVDPRNYRKEPLQDEENYVYELIVRAYDLGTPSLSGTVKVEIFTQEIFDRTMRFKLPQTVQDIRRNQSAYESMLLALTGGKHITNFQVSPFSSLNPDAEEINGMDKDQGPQASGRDPRIVRLRWSNIVCMIPENSLSKYDGRESTSFCYCVCRSMVTAVVRLPTEAIVDVDAIAAILASGSGNRPDVTRLQAANTDLQAIIVALAVVLVLIVLGLLFFFTYYRRKQVEREKLQRIRDEEIQTMTGEHSEGPHHLSDRHPGERGWSPDGRPRYHRVRSPTYKDRARGQGVPGDILTPVVTHERDEIRVGRGGDGERRVFVIRNREGLGIRDPDHLREGETYVLEDLEDERGSHRDIDGRPGHGPPHGRFSQIGDAEVLTLDTPPKGRNRGRDGSVFVSMDEYERHRGQERGGRRGMSQEKSGKEMIMHRFMNGGEEEEAGEEDREDESYEDEDDEDGEGGKYGRRRKNKRFIHTPIAEETMSALEMEMREGRRRSRENNMETVPEENLEQLQQRKGGQQQHSDEPPRTPSPNFGYNDTKSSKLRRRNSIAKVGEDEDPFIHSHGPRSSMQNILEYLKRNERDLAAATNSARGGRRRRNSVAGFEGSGRIGRRKSSFRRAGSVRSMEDLPIRRYSSQSHTRAGSSNIHKGRVSRPRSFHVGFQDDGKKMKEEDSGRREGGRSSKPRGKLNRKVSRSMDEKLDSVTGADSSTSTSGGETRQQRQYYRRSSTTTREEENKVGESEIAESARRRRERRRNQHLFDVRHESLERQRKPAPLGPRRSKDTNDIDYGHSEDRNTPGSSDSQQDINDTAQERHRSRRQEQVLRKETPASTSGRPRGLPKERAEDIVSQAQRRNKMKGKSGTGKEENLSDDVKILRSADGRGRRTKDRAALDILDGQIRLGMVEDDHDHDHDHDSGISSVGGRGSLRDSRRNRMLEKKSIFSIAYDEAKNKHINEITERKSPQT